MTAVTQSGNRTEPWNQVAVLGLFLLLFAASGSAFILIDVGVHETIDGTAPQVAASDGFPQHVDVTWENIGSVGCTARARVQYQNASTGKLVHEAWSTESKLWPGAFAEWRITTVLPAGRYTYSADVFHCSKRIQVDNGTLHSTGPQGHSTADTDVTLRTQTATRDTIHAYVTPGIAADMVHVVPTAYPPGWKVPSTTVTDLKADTINHISLPYTASIWEQETITYILVTADGQVMGKLTAKTEPAQTATDRLLQTYFDLILSARKRF